MASTDRNDTPIAVEEEVAGLDKQSAIAVVGHPIHAMMVHFPIAFVVGTFGADMLYWWSADDFWLRAGIWAIGFAFVSGVAAAIVGTAELLLVPGIRVRVTSWSHAVAAMTFLAIVGTNWGLRLIDIDAVLPHGLGLSVLGTVFAGIAGWQGGKLIFDHGVGIAISPKE
jgi:uncharacterized membrane protein